MDTREILPAPATRSEPPGRQRPRGPAWLPRLLIESLLIAFSVLFALALAEWRDARRQDARARLAAAAIIAEVTSNRSASERASNYHRMMHDTLSAIAAAGQLPADNIAYGGLLQPAQVISTAWTSAREAGALEQWPYDLVLQVSRVYERQAAYDALIVGLVSDIYGDIRRRGAEPVLRVGYRGFVALTQDLANRERNLVEEYDSVLAVLERAKDEW